MPISNFNRRRFLQGLGISAATIPFVIGLDSLYAKADAPPDMKKRFLFMYTPNGGLYSHFRLRVHGPAMDISDGTALADPNLVYHPLQANAANLMVLDRLSWVSARQEYQTAATAPDKTNHPGGHQKGMGSLLTGTTLQGGTNDFGNAGLGSGISVDQVLATKVFSSKKFPSLEVGVQVDENLTDRYVDKRVSYDAPIKPRAPNCDPFALFASLFGTPGGTNNDKALRTLLDGSVLDNAYKDFARLQPKLSGADQKLLQQHADSVRRLENQLSTVVDCGTVMPPTAQAGLDTSNATATHKWAMTPANFPLVGAMMTDIIVEAMACGLTNVVTFMWANSEANLGYPWIPGFDTTSTRGHHDMSHARDPNLVLIDQWYAS